MYHHLHIAFLNSISQVTGKGGFDSLINIRKYDLSELIYNRTCIHERMSVNPFYFLPSQTISYACFGSKPQDRQSFHSFLLFLNMKSWPVCVPLTWRRPEGAAMLLGPAGWVEAWVEVKEPEGCRRVWEALCANHTQLQPSSDVFLNLSGPGQPQVNTVLELHITACTQQLHWVSSTLGLWGQVGEG